MNPLLEQFLSESRELIERSSDAFLSLEKDATNPDILNALFRYVHTLYHIGCHHTRKCDQRATHNGCSLPEILHSCRMAHFLLQ